MNTITIIATAYRANLEQGTNDSRNAEAHYHLVSKGTANEIRFVNGVYKEEGQALPTKERSMMFNIKEQDLQNVISLFCGKFQQDCILVSSEEKGVSIVGLNWEEKLGNYLALVNNVDGLSAYTELGQGLYLAVK